MGTWQGTSPKGPLPAAPRTWLALVCLSHGLVGKWHFQLSGGALPLEAEVVAGDCGPTTGRGEEKSNQTGAGPNEPIVLVNRFIELCSCPECVLNSNSITWKCPNVKISFSVLIYKHLSCISRGDLPTFCLLLFLRLPSSGVSCVRCAMQSLQGRLLSFAMPFLTGRISWILFHCQLPAVISIIMCITYCRSVVQVSWYLFSIFDVWKVP